MKNSLGKNYFFDAKMGFIGAFAMGVIVYFINADHDPSGAVIAASKQFFYTFFIGGFFTKMVENLAITWDDKTLSVFLAIVIPALLTITLTFIMHNLKGTPEPINSTIPTTFLAPLSFSVWAILKRIEYDKMALEDFV